jgi:hypothetical protein
MSSLLFSFIPADAKIRHPLLFPDVLPTLGRPEKPDKDNKIYFFFVILLLY